MTTGRFQSILLLTVIAFCSAVAVRADDYSTDNLLSLGAQAWNHSQCVKVGEYFFAYQLRNPPALQDAQHRANVAQALSWCEQHATVGADQKSDDPNGAAGRPPVRPSLNLSGPSAGGSDRRCNIYARLAVAQNDANVASQCGLSGGRWSSDYGYHYNWCVGVASGETSGESLARTNLLNSCTP